MLHTQTGATTFNYSIPLNVVYPLYVSIEADGCDPHREIFAVGNPNEGFSCDLLNFNYEIVSSGNNHVTVKFIIPPYTPNLTWDFGYGAPFSSPPTSNTQGTFTQTFYINFEF